MSVIDRVVHKKHFYKVTWERSAVLLKTVPWLKDVKEDFCMVGYREPTFEEADSFIGRMMYDRLFDQVCGVEEISKEEALREFDMEDWRYQKVFAYDEFHSSLDAVLHTACVRSELTAGERVVAREFERF